MPQSSFYADGETYDEAVVESNDHTGADDASQAPSSFYATGGVVGEGEVLSNEAAPIETPSSTPSSFYRDGGLADTGVVESNDAHASTVPSNSPSSFYPQGTLYNEADVELTETYASNAAASAAAALASQNAAHTSEVNAASAEANADTSEANAAASAAAALASQNAAATSETNAAASEAVAVASAATATTKAAEAATSASNALTSETNADTSEANAAASAADAAASAATAADRVFRSGDTMTGALTVGSSGVGSTALRVGDTVNPGYIDFFTPDGTRRGFIGWSSGNNLLLQSENSWNWRMTGSLAIAAVGDQLRLENGYGVIHRNDGSSYYTLLTNSGDPTGTWNGLRPWTVNLSNGNVSMGHSVQVGGTLAVGNGSPSGTAGDISSVRPSSPGTGYVWLGNSAARYLGYDGSNYVMPGTHLYTAAGRVWGTSDGTPMFTYGGTMGGNLATPESQGITYGGPVGTLEVAGAAWNGSWAAMSFHVHGAFAVNFGLNANGNFYMGGWSHGGTYYQFWTTRDAGQIIQNCRLAYAGDASGPGETMYEPYGGAVGTGIQYNRYGDLRVAAVYLRYRYFQVQLNGGGWATIGYV